MGLKKHSLYFTNEAYIYKIIMSVLLIHARLYNSLKSIAYKKLGMLRAVKQN